MKDCKHIIINGELLGSKVIVNSMFRAIAEISPVIMQEFVRIINKIEGLVQPVKINKFDFPTRDSICIDFSNNSLSGCTELCFELRNGQPILIDADIKFYGSSDAASASDDVPPVNDEALENELAEDETVINECEPEPEEITEEVSEQSIEAVAETLSENDEIQEICKTEEPSEEVAEDAEQIAEYAEPVDVPEKVAEFIQKVKSDDLAEEQEINETEEKDDESEEMVSIAFGKPESAEKISLLNDSENLKKEAIEEVREIEKREEFAKPVEPEMVNEQSEVAPVIEQEKLTTPALKAVTTPAEPIAEEPEFEEEPVSEVPKKKKGKKKSAKKKEKEELIEEEFTTEEPFVPVDDFKAEEPCFEPEMLDFKEEKEAEKEEISDDIIPAADCVSEDDLIKISEPAAEKVEEEAATDEYDSLYSSDMDDLYADSYDSMADFYENSINKPEDNLSKMNSDGISSLMDEFANLRNEMVEMKQQAPVKTLSDLLTGNITQEQARQLISTLSNLDEEKIKAIEDYIEMQQESKADTYGDKFRIMLNGETIKANAVDGELFIAGNRLYRWGDMLHLDE